MILFVLHVFLTEINEHILRCARGNSGFYQETRLRKQIRWAHLEMWSQTLGRFSFLMIFFHDVRLSLRAPLWLKYDDRISRCAWDTSVLSWETWYKVQNTLSTSRDVLAEYKKISSLTVGLVFLTDYFGLHASITSRDVLTNLRRVFCMNGFFYVLQQPL